MNIVLSRELFDTVYPEAMPLIEVHNRQAEPDEPPVELAAGFYRQMEADGKLRIYTVRDADSLDLKGYAVFFLTMHQHRARFTATCDAFFPGVRGAGLALLYFIERELEKEGVERICYESRPAAPEFGELLGHLHYLPVSQTFGKDVN